MTTFRLFASSFTVATGLATFAALAGGPTTIAGEDPVMTALAPAAALSWAGLYVGLGVALPTGDSTFEEETGGETTPGDWDGTLAYATAGYNWQSGNIVYGAALDLTFGSIEAVSPESPSFGCLTDCVTEVGRYAALRGRIGTTIGSALIYGTAGLARADAEGSSNGGTVNGSGSVTGWVAGVGVEYRMTDRLSIDGAYLYNDLGTLDLPDNCGLNCTTYVTFGQVRIGANLRF